MGASLQDFGRPGWRRFGVPAGGVMDRFSATAANRLAGNPPDAPVLELLHSGACVEFLRPVLAAVAGAEMGGEIAAWSAREVGAGERIVFKGNRSGLWAYLAVSGGFSAERWFGSVSTNARAGFGTVLRNGARLTAATRNEAFASGVAWRLLAESERRDFNRPPALRLFPGPRCSEFSGAALETLTGGTWSVSPRSDRTGFRLDGPRVDAPQAGRSQPVLPGSIQIPGDGAPIVTMNDGPTVGGYPVAAVLAEADRDWFAQCRPGMTVFFRWHAS